MGRPSRRGVDRNSGPDRRGSHRLGRPSRRGVDRNLDCYAAAWAALRVAPHAGAWIETRLERAVSGAARCRPSRRGVDRNQRRSTNPETVFSVAPHAGAWIETLPRRGGHLSRGGGRPSRRGVDRNPCRLSFPIRHGAVAPHAGAWIETEASSCRYPIIVVAPHAGAWIETNPCRDLYATVYRRPSRRGVDRNRDVQDAQVARLRRSPLTQGRGSKP